MSTQKLQNDKDTLVFTVIYPDRPMEEYICDSVIITVKDGISGENGGLYGIRKGHSPAVFLLDSGKAEAKLNGISVFSGNLGEGFAKVENNRVTAVCDK